MFSNLLERVKSLGLNNLIGNNILKEKIDRITILSSLSNLARKIIRFF